MRTSQLQLLAVVFFSSTGKSIPSRVAGKWVLGSDVEGDHLGPSAPRFAGLNSIAG